MSADRKAQEPGGLDGRHLGVWPGNARSEGIGGQTGASIVQERGGVPEEREHALVGPARTMGAG